MPQLSHPAHRLLDTLDGFRVEIDPARERADIVLHRPPLNVILMPQRDQLRLVFESLDADPAVRVIVLRAEGEHFSSGGDIKGFLQASPEHVSNLAWNIAAPARCSKPVIAANRGYCFGVGFEARPDSRFGRLSAASEDGRHHSHQGYRDALTPNSRTSSVRLGRGYGMRARCRAGGCHHTVGR
jgi:Enoyl-CoA hydratase/isomerase